MCKRIMTSFVFIYYCSLALPYGISYHSWLACTSLYIVHIHVGHYTKFLISNQGTWSISVLRTEKPWKVLFSSNPILCELFDLCDSRWLSLHNMEFELIVSCCRWIFSMFFFFRCKLYFVTKVSPYMIAPRKNIFCVMLIFCFLYLLKVNIFRGFTLPDAPRFAQVFGGQLIGQACFSSFLLKCFKLL